MQDKIYKLKNRATGKFLSHLFEDSVESSFRGDGGTDSYGYNALEVAQTIANTYSFKVDVIEIIQLETEEWRT